jgi:hypothetical protein
MSALDLLALTACAVSDYIPPARGMTPAEGRACRAGQYAMAGQWDRSIWS